MVGLAVIIISAVIVLMAIDMLRKKYDGQMGVIEGDDDTYLTVDFSPVEGKHFYVEDRPGLHRCYNRVIEYWSKKHRGWRVSSLMIYPEFKFREVGSPNALLYDRWQRQMMREHPNSVAGSLLNLNHALRRLIVNVVKAVTNEISRTI